jgi:hypothetical protein
VSKVASQTRLRLAPGASPGGWRTPPAEPVRLKWSENEAAADPRWVLAMRTAGLLEGGRAALLTPERRRRLTSLASRMGVRPFDAALVIAVVQDAARAGMDPLGPEAESRLWLIRTGREDRQASPGTLLALSLAMAVGMFGAAVLWLGLV